MRTVALALTTAISLLLGLARPSLACDPGTELLITEIVAANETGLVDNDGDHSDWIEIYNPCAADVDLGGWYLTDDPSVPTRWRFPSVHLARGEFLTVFASAKDRAVAGSPLHTNFKLAAEGEYLALVKPDGFSVAHAFSPAYPAQVPDVSYGLEQSATTPVGPSAALSLHVPTSADAVLGTTWTAPSYNDGSWETGTSGLGYTSGTLSGFDITYYKANIQVADLSAAEAVIADPGLRSATVLTSAAVVNYLNTGGAAHFAADQPFPSTQIGVDVNDFVVLATTTVVIPQAGLWTFGVNSDDGFGLTLTRQPTQFSTSFAGTRPPGDTLAVFNIPQAGAWAVRLVFFERGGGSGLELFAAQGSHAAFDSAFRLVGDTAGGGLPASDFGALIGTDVRTRMQNVCSSIWSRVRFEATAPVSWDLLTMRMAYEDGFVAFLNGTEVARRNAPSTVLWNSASATDRPVDDAAVPEKIDLSSSIALVTGGTNVLAIQGLNESVSGADFLLHPELSAANATSAASPARYFPAPTPAAFNTAGFPGVAPEPVFSHESAAFVDSFFLTLSTSAPSGVIRYTLDGSDPTAASTAYTAPFQVADSARVRARVFVAGLAPSAAVTRLYAKLGADVLGFTSNLPIVVVDTFGSSITDGWLTESLTAVIPTSAGRAAIVGSPDFQGAAGIKLRGSSSLGFAKKQYALETWDGRSQDLDVSFLGMPAESDWILNGTYNDKTLLRNFLAYGFSNAIGRYAVRTRLVEMYLRSSTGAVTAADYVGVYVLMEKIKRGPDRVDVTELLPTDSTAPAVTGGYLLKKDRLDPGDAGFYTSSGQRLAYVDPKESEITAAQAAYIQGYLNEFESVLYGAGFADPVNGYAKYVDLDSFIDHNILVEMTKNIDGFRLSTFMFKDRLGKLNMGPIWDYDLSQGNANYLDGWLPTGWYHDLIGDPDYPWFRRIFEDPEASLRYADRWFELRRGPFATSALLADIDAQAAVLAESQVRNFAKWQILGVWVWPNWFVGATYESEIDWMKDWLEARVAWMDSQFVAPPVFNHAPGGVPFGFDLTLSAAAGSIYYTLDGSDPRLPGGAVSPAAILYASPISVVSTTRVRARSKDGTVWSAMNDGTFTPIPPAVVNEVLPTNGSVLADEHGDHDPWIELYNPGTSTVELSGLFLTDDPAAPAKWALPGGTSLCGHGWLLVWADGETAEGSLHASFRPSASGGALYLYDLSGRLVDSLAYPALPANVSFGRTPDGSATLARFSHATPEAANSKSTTRILVNEYNGVSPDKFLSGSDTFWGHALGNGGDWFELVVVEDHLDLRGWNVVVDDNSGAMVSTLVFTNAALLSDLRAGTIVTVSEELQTDASYSPASGDWWINLNSGTGGDGTYVSAVPFNTSNSNTQITILDAQGAVAYGPAGEGINPASGVGSDEVFKLEESPGAGITAYSSYHDGTSSTFGAPNLWNSGLTQQDFGPLRSVVTCTTSASCDDGNPCTNDVCVAGSCTSTPNTASCDDGNACTTNDRCQSGICAGDAQATCCTTDCDCNDGNACTLDACVGGTCTHAALANGTACNDGDVCTWGDTCSSGACTGMAMQVPGEIAHVGWDGDKQTLRWDSDAFSGPGTVHDVVRGIVQQLPVGSGAGETCMATGAVGAALLDAGVPALGQGFWYDVRGRNTCGVGTYGFKTDKGIPIAERVTLICP